jgi:hypothetical protein
METSSSSRTGSGTHSKEITDDPSWHQNTFELQAHSPVRGKETTNYERGIENKCKLQYSS